MIKNFKFPSFDASRNQSRGGGFIRQNFEFSEILTEGEQQSPIFGTNQVPDGELHRVFQRFEARLRLRLAVVVVGEMLGLGILEQAADYGIEFLAVGVVFGEMLELFELQRELDHRSVADHRVIFQNRR